MTAKRHFSERPLRQKYTNYSGILGVVVGIEGRDSVGHIYYKVKCADCGEIHIRDAKQLKQGIKTQDCRFYKPPNWSGLERHDNIMRKKYGLSVAEFDTLLKLQNNCCAICKKHITALRRRMNIDHDHETGKIRGILCTGCNTGLGHLGDNIEGLEIAIEYLKNPPINALAR